MRRFDDLLLQHIRNDVPVRGVIAELGFEPKRRGSSIRFRCPICGKHQLALVPGSNLARCFVCARSFNPIDLVMHASSASFVDAVRRLAARFDAPTESRQASEGR